MEVRLSKVCERRDNFQWRCHAININWSFGVIDQVNDPHNTGPGLGFTSSIEYCFSTLWNFYKSDSDRKMRQSVEESRFIVSFNNLVGSS